MAERSHQFLDLIHKSKSLTFPASFFASGNFTHRRFLIENYGIETLDNGPSCDERQHTRIPFLDILFAIPQTYKDIN